jgi:hypothetical protein
MTRFTPANFFPLLLLFIFCATVLAGPTLHQDIINVSGTPENIDSVDVEKTADGKPSGGVDYTEENANLQQVAETPEPSRNIKVCKMFLTSINVLVLRILII